MGCFRKTYIFPTETNMTNLNFLEKYRGIEAEPLWTVMNAMVPPRPSPKSVPHVWEYQKLKPALLEAGERIKADEAERRVLMLVNPARGKKIKICCNTAPK